MAPQVVAACPDETLPATLAGVLTPAVLLSAHRRDPRWRLSRANIDRIAGTVWGGAFVAREAAHLPPDERASVAETLWSGTTGDGKGAVESLGHLASDVLLALLVDENLPAERFDAALIPADVAAVGNVLDLPARFRLPLVRWAMERQPGEAGMLGMVLDQAFRANHLGVADRVDVEDVPWVELLAGGNAVSGGFARAIWRLAPDLARARARNALAGHDREGWFQAAPESLHPMLIEWLEESSGPLAPWLVLWLRRRILEGGVLADRAHRLLSRAGVASDETQAR
jgi:hypothetical protein